MKKCFVLFAAAACAWPLLSQTAAPAKPPNATGICRDGTYSTAASKSGACQGHKGVQKWYATAPTPATPATAPPASAATPAASASAAKAASPATPPSGSPQPATAPTPTAAKKGPKANAANTPAAPGGGPNLVWVNTSSNVYHCPGSDFYGKTKAGSYMTEADAKAKGARPNHGNACSK